MIITNQTHAEKYFEDKTKKSPVVSATEATYNHQAKPASNKLDDTTIIIPQHRDYVNKKHKKAVV